MKTLEITEMEFVSGGVWCTYDGKACSGCANMIEIAGNDCSMIKGNMEVKTGHIKTGDIIFVVASGYSSAIVGIAAASALGVSMVPAAGIAFVFGTAIGLGYILAH